MPQDKIEQIIEHYNNELARKQILIEELNEELNTISTVSYNSGIPNPKINRGDEGEDFDFPIRWGITCKRMEKSIYLEPILSFYKGIFNTFDYSIEKPFDYDTNMNSKLTYDFFTEQFKQAGGLKNLIVNIAYNTLVYGFSFFTPKLEIRNGNKYGFKGKLDGLRGFKYYDPTLIYSFIFKEDDSDELQAIRMYTQPKQLGCGNINTDDNANDYLYEEYLNNLITNKQQQLINIDFDLAKGNKALKEQNKLLNNSYKKMNLMKMAGSKLKAGFLGLGGLALGGAAGLLGGVVNGYKGTLSTQLRAKNVGLSIGEHDALAYAGKMTGLGEDTLISAIEGLTTSMEDFDKWGNFASLGLHASDLQKKNPTEALFEVLESMKDSDLPQYLKKQIIDDIGIPFDNFRFVLKEGTGEIEKFFKEGFELNKNNDKYAKGEWVKNEKTGKMEKTKGLIDAERETIRFTENFGGMMKHISYDIAPTYIDGMKQITDLLPKLEDTISKSIMWGIDFVKGFAETPKEDRAKYISQELWKPLGDMLGGVFESGLKSMTDSLKEQFKPLVDGWEDLKGAFKSPKAFFEYFFTNDKELSANPEISETFKKKGVGLSSYGNMINAYLAGDQQQNYIVSLLEALKNQELSKNEAKTFRGFFNDKKWENDYGITKDFFDNYKQKQVNDAIITPNNQLITTSPKDYIFAMKRPEDLAALAAAGSSSSKGSNYTITINNPIVRNDGDIRKLKTQLEQLIKSFNSKR